MEHIFLDAQIFLHFASCLLNKESHNENLVLNLCVQWLTASFNQRDEFLWGLDLCMYRQTVIQKYPPALMKTQSISQQRS